MEHLRRLRQSDDYKNLIKDIESNILEPLKRDLITKKYETLEERNIDQKTYEKFKEFIEYPERVLTQKKSPRINNTEVYE
jgi:hypothetical protein